MKFATMASDDQQLTLFSSAPGPAKRCKITLCQNGFAVSTPYSAEFVDALKIAIPFTSRGWDKDRRAWLVALKFGTEIQELIFTHYGERVGLPTATPGAQETVSEQIIILKYIGACREREIDGKRVLCATGYVGEAWGYLFPKKTLRAFWEGNTAQEKESAPATLYSDLGLKQTKSLTAEKIKSAFRRLALQWHPDQCREPEARERFESIKKAYDVLSNPQRRKRYDAGLLFEKLANQKAKTRAVSGAYSAPLRCGLLKVRGKQLLNRFLVEEILSWEDMVDYHGRTMSNIWDGEKVIIFWV